jgi:hypothetical protein
VPNRRILRFVTALLLAWAAVDLAAIDTCALDFEKQPASAQATLSLSARHGPSPHAQVVLHPDHCFCHGLSTGADTSAAMSDPFSPGGAVSDGPPGHLLQASASLDHPPQRPA